MNYHIVRMTKANRFGKGRWAIAVKYNATLGGSMLLSFIDGEDRHFSELSAIARVEELRLVDHKEGMSQ